MSTASAGAPGPVVAVVNYTDRVPSGLLSAGEEATLRAASTRERLEAILPEAEVALIWDYKSDLLKGSWGTRPESELGPCRRRGGGRASFS